MADRTAVALGAAPLIAGAIVPISAVSGIGTLCPFRAVTGLPCPLCGATRAFVYAGHLDGRWVQYGAVWVVAAVVVVALALRTPRLRWSGTSVAALAAVAWAWALVHADAIVDG